MSEVLSQHPASVDEQNAQLLQGYNEAVTANVQAAQVIQEGQSKVALHEATVEQSKLRVAQFVGNSLLKRSRDNLADAETVAFDAEDQKQTAAGESDSFYAANKDELHTIALDEAGKAGIDIKFTPVYKQPEATTADAPDGGYNQPDFSGKPKFLSFEDIDPYTGRLKWKSEAIEAGYTIGPNDEIIDPRTGKPVPQAIPKYSDTQNANPMEVSYQQPPADPNSIDPQTGMKYWKMVATEAGYKIGPNDEIIDPRTNEIVPRDLSNTEQPLAQPIYEQPPTSTLK